MTKNFINISKNLIYKNYVKILFLLRKKNKMSQESLSQKFLKIKDSKLSPEEAYKILKDFNPDIHNNVNVINKPEPGQIYFPLKIKICTKLGALIIMLGKTKALIKAKQPTSLSYLRIIFTAKTIKDK